MNVREQYVNMVINMIKNAEEIYNISIEPDIRVEDYSTHERIVDTKVRKITIELKRGDDKDENSKEYNKTGD